MKSLIVDDDFTNRVLLQRILEPFGQAHVAVNGREGLDSYGRATEEGEPFDLVCLDIMMPEMDGQEALKAIRDHEREQGFLGIHGARILMTTALNDRENMAQAFREDADGYLVKPISKGQLLSQLKDLDMIS